MQAKKYVKVVSNDKFINLQWKNEQAACSQKLSHIYSLKGFVAMALGMEEYLQYLVILLSQLYVCTTLSLALVMEDTCKHTL